jgi:SNF2 family DNA or RNA helicase
MKFATNWLKYLKISLLSIFIATLFLFVNVSASQAISFPSQSEIQVDFDRFVEQSQQFLAEKIQETQTVLKNLPENLEEAVTEVDSARRKDILADLQDSQQQLKETAKAYKEYAKKADKLEREMLRSAKQSRAELKTDSRQKVEDLKDSLRQTSDAINILLDDTKQAMKDTSALSKARVEQHTQALQQALNNSDEALKTLLR